MELVFSSVIFKLDTVHTDLGKKIIKPLTWHLAFRFESDKNISAISTQIESLKNVKLVLE